MLRDLLAVGPRSVALMLTTRCNLCCDYCYQERTAPRSMPPGVFEAALSRFCRSDWQEPTLILYGGEPLLEAALVRRAVETIRRDATTVTRPDVRIFTNGLLLDTETEGFLVEGNVHVTLSTDGLPGAQDHRAPGSFWRIDRLLRRFRRDHPCHFRDRFAVSLTLTSANIRYLADSFRYFVFRGVCEVRVSPVVTGDSGWGPAARAELDRQLAEVVEVSLEAKKCSGGVPFLAFRGAGGGASAQAESGALCGTASRKDLFVDVDGTLAPCSALAGSCRPTPSPLLRDANGAFGVLCVTDPGVEDKLASREQIALGIPFLTGKSLKRSYYGTCCDCPGSRECFVCPVSIALCGSGTDPNLIPAIQCDFNRLIAFHRGRFHWRFCEAESRENIQ